MSVRLSNFGFAFELNDEFSIPANIRPFRMAFHTDAVEAANGDMDNRGFCLDYVQQPCTNGK